MIHSFNLQRAAFSTASVNNSRHDINRKESCTIHEEESKVDSCLKYEAISSYKHA